MKTTKVMSWATLMILTPLALARADETPPEVSPPRQDDVQEVPADLEAFGWSGETPDQEALQKAIAAVRVLIQADGKLEQAETVLDEIWLKATALKGFDGQMEVLVQIALVRADLYRRQGKREAALQATKDLLIRKQDQALVERYRQNLAVANKTLLIRAVQAANDPRLIELRTELVDQKDPAGHDSLVKIVRNAYANNDFRVILEIGAPAQPAFADEIIADADEFPSSTGSDPLLYLLQLNERRAAEILLANLEAGGYLWKRRIVRAMDAVDVMNNDGTWSSDQPYVCLEPEWLSVLEALLSSPDTALQSIHLITEPFFRDQLTPGIQRAVVRGIETYDLDFVNAVLQALDHGGVVDSALPIFEAAARHSDPLVRRFAARVLTNYESNATLRSMVTDPDPEVRRSVVATLQPHKGEYINRWRQEHNHVWQQQTNKREYEPKIGDAERALLEELSSDSSAAVRRGVARALAYVEPPLDDEVYERLSRDENAMVRLQMAYISRIDTELRSQILTRLATDRADNVISSVDNVLEYAPLESDPTPYLGAMRLRLTDTRNPMDDSRSEVVDKLVASPQGMQAVATWMLAGDDRSLQDLLFERLGNNGYERLLGLDDAALGGMFARAHDYEGGNQSYYYNNTWTTIKKARPSRRGAMRDVLANTDHDVSVRLNAALLAAPDGGEAFRRDLVALLRDPHWKANPPTDDDLGTLQNAVQSMSSNERNALVLTLVADDPAAADAIPDTFVMWAASQYTTTGPLSRDVTLAVLARWFDQGGVHVNAVDTALTHLASIPDEADPELLKRAALSPHYAEAAVKTIVSLRQPDYLPTLELCMEAEWVRNESNRKRVRYDAVAGISSFLTDEAAEILLRGLASTDENVRMLCSSGLGHIETTRLRYAQWEESKQAQPTKESALAELLVMIDDDHQEIRMQAIQGIATFGAIEYLPTLIRLLEDPDGIIVEAAREAIDQLNREATVKRAAEED